MKTLNFKNNRHAADRATSRHGVHSSRIKLSIFRYMTKCVNSLTSQSSGLSVINHSLKSINERVCLLLTFFFEARSIKIHNVFTEAGSTCLLVLIEIF